MRTQSKTAFILIFSIVLTCLISCFLSHPEACDVCTKEGESDVEVCPSDFQDDVLALQHNQAILDLEAEGFVCEP